MNKFYIMDIDDIVLDKVLFESLFQNNESAPKILNLKSDYFELTNILIEPYALSPDIIPDPMEKASTLSHKYMLLSEDDNTYLNTLNFSTVPQSTPQPFYIKNYIPNWAVAGNFICGLRITADCIGEESIVGFEDWGAISEIVITGSPDGALTDFPVEITIPFDIEVMKLDFSDIRFIGSDKTTELGYYLKEYTEGVSATFLVKIPSISANPATTTIYVLTGNENATSNSNEEDVYDFIDYATGTYSDKWVNIQGTGGYGTVQGKQAILLNNAATLIRTNSFQISKGFKITAELLSSATITAINYCQPNTPTMYGRYQARIDVRNNYIEGILKDSGNVVGFDAFGGANTWCPVEITLNENGKHIYTVNGVKVTEMTDTTYSSGYIALIHHNLGTGAVANLKIIKYLDSPPTAEINEWRGCSNHQNAILDINLNGCVFDESPMSSPRLTSNDLRVSTQEGDYYNITNFSIQRRKSDGTSNFEVIISSSEDEQFLTGQVILFEEIQGNQTRKIYEGIIQEVIESVQGAEKNYNISGRHISLGLINKGSGVLCAGKTVTNRTVNQLLNIILADTGITVGPGVDLNIGNIPNKTTVFPGWCGSYDTKKSALDSLMNMISLKKGKTINWFIDDNNQLRTFYTEDKNGDIGVTITKDNPRLISMTTSENAENIVNDLYGYAGENSEITVHRQDLESINGWTDEDGFEHPGYGLIQGSSVVDNSITSTGMIAQKTQAILNRQSKPIYTVSLILTRFPNVEPGQPLYIPDHYKYNNKTFIVSDITMQGSPGNWITTVLATTDINVVNPVGDFETVQAITRKAVQKSAPKAGVVLEVDGNQYVVQLVNGGTVVNVKGF